MIVHLGRQATTLVDNDDRRQKADRAATALCAVSDDRAVPWLVKMLHMRDLSRKEQAIQPLSRFNSRIAFEGLKEGLHTRAAEVLDCCTTRQLAEESVANLRMDAVRAMARSPYPGALSYLWTLRHNVNASMRLVIVEAIAAHPNNRTVAMLQEFSRNDPNQNVRDEARRSLDKLSRQTTGTA